MSSHLPPTSTVCRRPYPCPQIRVVLRATYGADFVVSFTTLGIDAVYPALQGQRPVVLEEGGDLFTRAASPSLAGTTLAESRIGEQTGLNVVTIEHNDAFKTDLRGDTTLPPDSHLVLIGSGQQMEAVVERY